MDARSIIIPFILTLIITPFVISFSHKRRLLDYPKNNSIHITPVPVTGGLMIMSVFFILNLILNPHINLLALFISALPIVASGIYDDLKGMNAAGKLTAQFISAMILVTFGITINTVSIHSGRIIPLGIFSAPATVLWFLFIINLINITDGLDGLAAGLCAIIFFIILLFTGSSPANTALAILLGALLGFLIFNFYPARIFLGNSGSMLLGLFVAYFSLVNSQKSTIVPILLVPCGILLLQIIDAGYSIIRRTREGVSIFKGDKKHLHYMALNIIKNHGLTVLLFYFLSLILAYLALRICLS